MHTYTYTYTYTDHFPEFMGEVVEVGSGNSRLKVGQRVVVPFVIACGQCYFCGQTMIWCVPSNGAVRAAPADAVLAAMGTHS